MKLLLQLFVSILYLTNYISSKQTYMYEKDNFFGLGRRFMSQRKSFLNNFGAFPEPLPSTTYVPVTSLRSIYQGNRGVNDTRVFRRRFDYQARSRGQHILCEGLFNCSITFLAIESTEAIPILLRGGAGYKHFTTVVKAKPGRELKGQVRAYCKSQTYTSRNN